MLSQQKVVERNEIARVLGEFAKTLLPAQLYTEGDPGIRNGTILAFELQKRNLVLSVANLVRITKDILFETKLEWVPGYEPAYLKARTQHEAVRNQSDVRNDVDAFAQKVRAGEAADAQRKLDEASIKECKALIASFSPTRTTPRGTAVNYAKQASEQARLTAALNRAIEQKANLQEFTKAVAGEIQRQYSAEEKNRERI